MVYLHFSSQNKFYLSIQTSSTLTSTRTMDDWKPPSSYSHLFIPWKKFPQFDLACAYAIGFTINIFFILQRERLWGTALLRRERGRHSNWAVQIHHRGCRRIFIHYILYHSIIIVITSIMIIIITFEVSGQVSAPSVFTVIEKCKTYHCFPQQQIQQHLLQKQQQQFTYLIIYGVPLFS